MGPATIPNHPVTGLAALAAPDTEKDAGLKPLVKTQDEMVRSHNLREVLDVLGNCKLPTHRIRTLHLGPNMPDVAIDRSARMPVLNLDRLPVDYNRKASLALGAKLAQAFCLCDLYRQEGITRISSHPLLEGDVRRLPKMIYDAALRFPILHSFAAHYLSALTTIDDEIGKLALIIGNLSAAAKALIGIFKPSTPIVDLSHVNEPTKEQPISRYLGIFQPCVFSCCYPEKVIGQSFPKTLTMALNRAIAMTCRDLGFPEFRGDPWDVLAAINPYQLTPAQKKLIEHFHVAGYPVAEWVRESQSAFFRPVGTFWTKLDAHLSILSERALSRGDNKLRFTVVGIGMNEEPLSLAMSVERFLDTHKLRGRLDYEIKVLSRENPTMRFLINSRNKGTELAIIYPTSSLPSDERFHKFFYRARGGFAPCQELSTHIDYLVSDITDKKSIPQTEPSADLVLVHNVFQYIEGGPNMLQTVRTIDSLCRSDGYISIAGDVLLVSTDEGLEALNMIMLGSRNFGLAK